MQSLCLFWTERRCTRPHPLENDMRHETAKMQRVAAWWHFMLAIGALGGVIYHAVAIVEHLKEADKYKHWGSYDAQP